MLYSRNDIKLKKYTIAAIYGILTTQLIFIVDTYAVNILWWDQWNFLKPLFEQKGFLDIFMQQHGPHRQGLAFVLTSILYHLTNWNVRIEAFSMVGLLVLTSFLFSYTSFRLNKEISLFDAAIPLMILTPTFYETIYQTPNASHGIFPLFLLSIIALGQTYKFWVRSGVTTVCGFTALYTGFGFFAGVMVILWAIRGVIYSLLSKNQPRLLVYAAALSIMTAGFYFFFKGYVFSPAVECFSFPHSPFYEYFLFMLCSLGFFGGLPCSLGGHVFHLSVLIGFIQALILIAVFVDITKQIKVKGNKIPRYVSVCFFLLGFSTMFLFATTIGRVCLGVSANAFRYLPLLTPAYIALYFYLRQKNSSTWTRWILLALITGFVLKIFVFSYPLCETTMPSMVEISEGKKRWIESYLETQDLEKASIRSGFRLYPDDPAVLTKRMQYLQKNNLCFFQYE